MEMRRELPVLDAALAEAAGSDDALKEEDAQFRATGRVIIPLTVKDILEEQLARKLA